MSDTSDPSKPRTATPHPRTVIGNPSASRPPQGAVPDPAASGSLPPVAPGQELAPGVIAPSPPAVDPYLGSTIAERYRLDRKLGEGGMGIVYLGHHVVLEKAVAVKVLADELSRRPDLVQRFLQEAKAASRIHHENIVDITDFGQTASGTVFFVMELLEGRDLATLIRQDVGAVPWARAKPILVQICRALAAAHGKGIIHRDMKPENVFLVAREGSGDFVKVLDFGIAKMTGLEESSGARLTRTGMIFGTPEYMSPEQAHGTHPDHRVDVYAVGVIMYEMLTGQVPFRADTFMGVLTKHMFEAPVPPSQVRPDLGITPELDAIVLRALAKDRNERFQSMAELGSAVAAVTGGTPISFGMQAGPVGGRTVGHDAGAAAGATVPMGPSFAAHRAAPGAAPGGPAELPGRLSEVVDVPRSRAGLWVALVVVALIVLGGSFLGYRALSGSATAGGAAPADASAAAGEPSPAVAAADAGAPRAVVPPPATPPARPARVEVAINSRPAGAQVLQGAKRLGTTPTKLTLPYGTAELTLVLRKPGHEDKTVQVTPDRNRDLEVELARVVRRPHGRPPATKAPDRPRGDKIPDLKNPFDD